MKVTILHQDLEVDERLLRQAFEDRDCRAELLDVREIAARFEYGAIDVLVNRVYASVANRSATDNLRALDFVRACEERGVLCINGSRATEADYSKFRAYEMMVAEDVPTPPTLLLRDLEDLDPIRSFAREHDYPLIVKRDLGGRGQGVYRVLDFGELRAVLGRLETRATIVPGSCGIIVQPFIAPVRDHDARIAMLAGEVIACHGRRLIPLDSEDAWLASGVQGSETLPFVPDEAESALALRATAAIGAFANAVDVHFSADGPLIIENNPTPNHIAHRELRIGKLAEKILQAARDR